MTDRRQLSDRARAHGLVPMRLSSATLTLAALAAAVAAFAAALLVGLDTAGWITLGILAVGFAAMGLTVNARLHLANLRAGVAAAERPEHALPVRSPGRTVARLLAITIPFAAISAAPALALGLAIAARHHDHAAPAVMLGAVGALALLVSGMLAPGWLWLARYEQAEGVRLVRDPGVNPKRGVYLLPGAAPARAAGSVALEPADPDRLTGTAMKWLGLGMAAFTVGEVPVGLAAAVSSTPLRIACVGAFLAYWAVVIGATVRHVRRSA